MNNIIHLQAKSGTLDNLVEKIKSYKGKLYLFIYIFFSLSFDDF